MAIARLDKIISEAGLASRREIKLLIKSGRVMVNGRQAASPEEKYEQSTAEIMIDGEAVSCAAHRYIMLNKPGGILSATEDRNQQTVISLLSPQLQRTGLFPVGRLDKDTTGLLLLTNDGDFAHRVISPKKHVPKLYKAAVNGVLDADDVSAFARGIVLADGTECMPARLEILKPSVALVRVYEGKYHQVKRMFAARGKYVTALERLKIGALELDSALKPGEYRDLSQEELEKVLFGDDE